VFLDHAEKLPLDVLAEVGAVAKDNAGKRSMQLVLAGRSSLLDMLRRQELGWINELVVSRYGLGPLEEDELADYVTRRLTAASGAGQPDVEFKNEALALVYDLTKGSPRLVNQLCDRVLSVSHMESARVIESAFVESAAQALDFARPDEKWRTLRPILTTALIGLGLGAIGAAGWIFRGQIERLVSAWWGRAG
jgi:general secretion pathway protein A